MEKVWKEIGDQEATLAIEEFGEYTDEIKGKIEHRERKALKKKVESEQHFEIYGKLKQQIEMRAYLDGPMDYAKNRNCSFE